jgi:hypothetical protein
VKPENETMRHSEFHPVATGGTYGSGANHSHYAGMRLISIPAYLEADEAWKARERLETVLAGIENAANGFSADTAMLAEFPS